MVDVGDNMEEQFLNPSKDLVKVSWELVAVFRWEDRLVVYGFLGGNSYVSAYIGLKLSYLDISHYIVYILRR